MSASPIRTPQSAELERRMTRSPAGEDGLLETPMAAEASTPEENAETQILHLQQALQEKERLVVALTDRLEQAAEQLDRVRRTGGDRALRRGTGGMPAELLEDHRATIDELKQTLVRWEEMQAGMTLGRLETQITELRDLIVGRGGTGGPIASSSAHAAPPDQRPSSKSWWEQQKAAMLGEAVPEVAAEPVEREHSGERASIGELEIPDAPAPLNYENLVLDEARAALQERDAVITRLREQLLLAQAAESFAGNDLGSSDLPDGLRERLELLEQQWQAKFRQVELDLSIERARLSREGAKVQSQRELIDKEMVRLGMNGRDQRGDRAEVDSGSRRRWFNFLQGQSSSED